jgi:hypothetical protein
MLSVVRCCVRDPCGTIVDTNGKTYPYLQVLNDLDNESPIAFEFAYINGIPFIKVAQVGKSYISAIYDLRGTPRVERLMDLESPIADVEVSNKCSDHLLIALESGKGMLLVNDSTHIPVSCYSYTQFAKTRRGIMAYNGDDGEIALINDDGSYTESYIGKYLSVHIGFSEIVCVSRTELRLLTILKTSNRNEPRFRADDYQTRLNGIDRECCCVDGKWINVEQDNRNRWSKGDLVLAMEGRLVIANRSLLMKTTSDFDYDELICFRFPVVAVSRDRIQLINGDILRVKVHFCSWTVEYVYTAPRIRNFRKRAM